MTFRAYIFFMAVASAIAIGAFFFVMTTVSPNDATTLDFILFYSTLAIGLVGSFAFIGTLVRVSLFRRRNVVTREVKTSFRQAILLSGATVVSLFLSSQSLFRFWTLFVLIIILVGIEYAALLMQRSRHR